MRTRIVAEPKRIAIPGADRAFKADPHTNPAALLGPGEKWLVDGLDWSWAFVVYVELKRFPRYCAGSNGTVWSRAVRRNRLSHAWIELRPAIRRGRRSTYRYVSPVHDGVGQPIGIHQLVAEAFYGPCPKGLECRHLDGDGENNNAYNLRWGTHKQNAEDTIRHGRTHQGSQHHWAVLSEPDIPVIFRLHAEGIPVIQIAKKYDVSDGTIHDVLNHVTWSHVDVPSMDSVECKYGDGYRDAGKIRQLHLRRGGSLNPNPKENNGVNNGPLRVIIEVINRGRYIFDRNHVRFECGHEGYAALKAKRGRCRKCKEMLAAAGTPWTPVPRSFRKTNKRIAGSNSTSS
jgi:hypothetical protein